MTVYATPKQSAFCNCPVYEVLFGGAAGGGKSLALLIDAAQQVDLSTYRALLIRRTFPELRELIHKSRELYGTHATYNATERVWTWPSGARIEFGYLSSDDDVYRYQGQEYSYLGFDELTHYSEFAYKYLLSRVRSTDERVKVKVRATSNPGGPGHGWVKARFVDPAPAATIIHDERTGQGRVFIPSLLRDNPHLAKTDYGQRLEDLPEADRKALLDGDWDAYTGSVFKLDRGVHVWTWAQFKERTGNEAIPDGWHVFRCMDWGYARPYAVYWIAVDYSGRMFVFREMYGVAKDSKGAIKANEGVRQEPEVVARKIKAIDRDVKCDHGIADPACWAKGKGDYGGGPSIVEVMAAQDVTWTAGKNDRIQGKMQVHQRLAHTKHEWPHMIFIAEECPQAIRTIPALEYDKHHVEDVDSDGEDHAYDAIRYACMSRPMTPTKRTADDAYQQRLKEIKEDGWTV